MPARFSLPLAARRHHNMRGSMLLTAMLLATGLALVLGTYLTLSRTSLKVAHRTFFANDAVNLAEAGVEEALYCFNQMAAGTVAATAWSGWTISGSNATRTLTPINRDQSAIGVIKVYVKGYDGYDSAPYVVAQATVTPFDGSAPIIKTVHLLISLSAGTVSHGLVGLEAVSLTGGASADSYDSNPTDSPTGPWLVYSSGIARSNASVVALTGSMSIGGGQINGNLYLGPAVTAPNSSKVTGSIITNYSATFPFPTYPTAASVSQSYNLGATIPATLPRAGDLPAADGRYYYFTTGTVRSFAVTASRNVTVVSTAGMAITSTTTITLPATSTLHVYLSGAFTIAGAGLNASGYAGALEIYTTTAIDCTIGNASQVVAQFHAPNAALTASGNSNTNRLSGRYIARTISAGGGHNFHYDEAMQGTVSATTYRVTRWLEFQSAADRATVAGLTENYLR